VKHIKILTKEGFFYIAESRTFKTVLVSGFELHRSNGLHQHLLYFFYNHMNSNVGCYNSMSLSVLQRPRLFLS